MKVGQSRGICIPNYANLLAGNSIFIAIAIPVILYVFSFVVRTLASCFSFCAGTKLRVVTRGSRIWIWSYDREYFAHMNTCVKSALKKFNTRQFSIKTNERSLRGNDFIKDADEYGVTNSQALADGDDMGRGTGVFLDVYNDAAGTSVDIFERKDDIKINRFNKLNTYPNF